MLKNELNNIKPTEMVEKITEFIKVVIYPLFIYLSLDAETTVILIILMILDSVFGAIKSVRLGRKFKRRLFFWGIMNKFIFIIIPIVLALCGKALKYDFSLAVDLLIKILIVSEVYSILGNVYSIKNKKEVEKLDAISRIIQALRTFMYKYINKGLNTLEENGGCKINKDESDN
tara:strand:- start:471 stop:992 length:522 start_codon:yes stop_codon:yes gene_type:complete